MEQSHILRHARAAASGVLAAAICMAICQIVGLAMGHRVADVLLYGLSLSCIAFGGTYAGVFFGAHLARGRGQVPQPTRP